MTTPANRSEAAEPPFDRVCDLFRKLCDLPADEQQAELARLCGSDEALRREVEAVLAEDAAPDSALDGAAIDATDGMTVPLLGPDEPERVDDYEILGRLGEGGMGVVYEARQRTPRRTVALKLIRPGFLTAERLHRFRNEAEVLGSLSHPGIAQVYQAGTARTPAGEQPYMAMELVSGERLDRYACKARLDVDAILELVARLCEAVHHAHRRGVVHRDLKPGNVLVTPNGTTKILDFGVARAARSDLETAVHTHTGELIGTLAYMSPEQVRADASAVDARTDVYALGVMAYELLTGRRPYDVDSQALPDAVRAITEDEPRPLGSIDRRLRGDVEVIVATAIAKEKERRYASAAAFAADIRRYLASEPIYARPVSRAYQLRKFARRNKAIVGGVATAFLAMATGTAIALWQASEANSARRAADQERRVALIEAYRGMLAAAQVSLETGNVSATVEALDRIPADQRRWEWHHLSSQLDRAAALVETPTSIASVLAPGGRLVTVSADGTVRWLDPFLGRLFHVAALDLEKLREAVLSADGRRVAAIHGPEARQVGLWELDPEDGVDSVFHGELDEAGSGLAICADGTRVAATSAGTACIWEPPAVAPIRWEHGAEARAMTISADGTRLGLLTEADGIGVFRLFDVAERRGTPDLDRDVVSLALSPDGSLAATGETDGVVRLRDAETGSVLRRLPASREAVRNVTFDGGGRRLAAAGANGTIHVWSLDEQPLLERNTSAGILYPLQPTTAMIGFSSPVRQLGFGGDGSYVVSRDEEGATRLFDSRTVPGLLDLQGRVFGVSPDGSRIVSGAANGDLLFWDGASGECYASIPHYPQELTSLSVSHDGTRIATGHRGEVLLRELASPCDQRRIVTGSTDVLAISFTPDATRLATLDAAGRTTVRETADTSIVFDISGTPSAHGDVRFSPSGRQMATARGRELTVRNAHTGTLIARLRVPTATIHAVAWIPRTDVIASGWSDGTIRLFDPSSGSVVGSLSRTSGAILSLAPFPDGSRLAAGSARGVIEIWDVPTERLTMELRWHRDGVASLEFSPDGARLLSASSAGALLIGSTSLLRERRSAAARLTALGSEVEARVRALFEWSVDPLRVAERLWRDPELGEMERRAALRWTLDAPLPDNGVQRDPFDGHALFFGGENQHVTAGGGTEALRMTDAFTIEMWIRPAATAPASGESPLLMQTVLNKEGEYQIALAADGELVWLLAGPDGWMSPWICSRYRASAGRWTHVALVREAAELRFYVNGRRVQTLRGPERIGDHHPTMNELRIGGRQHTPSGFIGSIDEVRIWSVARPDGDILESMRRPLATDEACLLSAWSFDEGRGSVAEDLTGRHPAAIVGPTWHATSREPR